MNNERIERMSKQVNSYLASQPPGSLEQLNAAKVLGLLLWFLCEYAETADTDEKPKKAMTRLWSSIMHHIDEYMAQPGGWELNATLRKMAQWRDAVK